MKFLKKFEEQKEELLGSFGTDTADIIITGDPKIIKDENKTKDYKYIGDILNMSTGGDGNYTVVKRWLDFKKDDPYNGIPDEIVIKLKED